MVARIVSMLSILFVMGLAKRVSYGMRQDSLPDSRILCRLSLRSMCSREDSNLHGLPHTVLSRTRLPIPPREQ